MTHSRPRRPRTATMVSRAVGSNGGFLTDRGSAATIPPMAGVHRLSGDETRKGAAA